MNCLVCGSRKTTQMQSHTWIHVCHNCRHVFSDRKVKPYEGRGIDYFNQNYNHQGITVDSPEEAWNPYLGHRYKILRRHGLLTHGTVVELGCMEGNFLKYVKDKHSIDVVGFEPNKEVAEMGAPIVKAGYFNKEEIGSLATLVYSFHVFEHVRNVNALVDEIYASLVYGGKIFIEVPVFDVDYHNEDHIHFFSFDSLLVLLDKFENHMFTVGGYTHAFDKSKQCTIQVSAVKV